MITAGNGQNTAVESEYMDYSVYTLNKMLNIDVVNDIKINDNPNKDKDKVYGYRRVEVLEKCKETMAIYNDIVNKFLEGSLNLKPFKK
jgi:hypothetical protein